MHEPVRCRRCGTSMVLYVIGEGYCRECRREIAAREAADAKRVARFPFPKELGPGRPAA